MAGSSLKRWICNDVLDWIQAPSSIIHTSRRSSIATMNVVLLLCMLVSHVSSFSHSQQNVYVKSAAAASDDTPIKRRDALKIGTLLVAASLGLDVNAVNAADQKIYSSNAKNMARLSNGDSSGGSVYDNNPSSPKARRRRAMVGCKNSSARSLAGKNIGQSNLSEKDCNQIVMAGDGTFMLDALTELDCPTCPYGIGSQ